MRSIKSLLALSLLLMFGLSSCKESYTPPVVTPDKGEHTQRIDELKKKNSITVADLKKKGAEAKRDHPIILNEDLVLHATVVANDVSGNIYRSLYIQDTTGGIAISVEKKNLHNLFPVGQEIWVELKGLCIFEYGGVKQIGYTEGEKNKTRIPAAIFDKQVVKDPAPADPSKVTAKKIKVSEASEDLLGTLVEIEGVTISEAGQSFASDKKEKPFATGRNFSDGSGAMIMWNSVYSKFAADKMPTGKGTLRGILSKFSNKYQLLLRSKEDVLNFTETPNAKKPDAPESESPQADAPHADGSAGSSQPGNSTPSNPSAGQNTSAQLLFPGADFENEDTFKSSLNRYGLKNGKIEDNAGHNSSKGLHITGSTAKNDYVFTAQKTNLNGKKPSKISFWLKGTSDRSLSINVYGSNSLYSAFNLDAVTSSKTIQPKTPSDKTQQNKMNSYTGTINVSDWALITLDVSALNLMTDQNKDVFAVKVGKSKNCNLYIDDIKFE